MPLAGPSSGRCPANPTLLAAFLTSEASPSIQSPDFGVDVAKIRNALEIHQVEVEGQDTMGID